MSGEVESKDEEKDFCAEDAEFAEKKKAKERSLHCAARRARKRRAGESRDDKVVVRGAESAEKRRTRTLTQSSQREEHREHRGKRKKRERRRQSKSRREERLGVGSREPSLC